MAISDNRVRDVAISATPSASVQSQQQWYNQWQQQMAQNQAMQQALAQQMQMGGAGGMVGPTGQPLYDPYGIQAGGAGGMVQPSTTASPDYQYGQLPKIPPNNLGIPDYLKYVNGELPWGNMPYTNPNFGSMGLGDPATWAKWDDNTRALMKSYLENQYYPGQANQLNWAQLATNSRQFYDTLGEQARLNTYNMGMTGKEFGLKEYLAQQELAQWAKQFDFQGKQWADQFGLDQQKQKLDDYYKRGLISNDQYGNETQRLQQQSQQNQWQQELGWGKQKFGTEQQWAQKKFGEEQKLAREQQQNELTQSRYAAFGRAQAPTARWASNW